MNIDIVRSGKWFFGMMSMLTVTLAVIAGTVWLGDRPAQANDQSFRFVVMGDSRGISNSVNESTLRNLLSKVKGLSAQPQFILFTGDQINGNTNIAGELSQWKSIVDDYYPISRYYTTLGNHEHDETLFSQAFSYLPNEQLSGYQRTAYYFDFGNSRFITLNSDRKDANGNYIVSARQRAWLEKLLRTSTKTHHFIQFHVPAYPNSNHYLRSLDANPAERDALWDILSRYNVTVAFVGHEHNYNRRYVDQTFNANGFQFKNPVHQLTIGGAGAPLYGVVKNNVNVQVMKAVYHYLVVDVSGPTATFKAYDENNNLIDEFAVQRPVPTPSEKMLLEAEDASLANGAKSNANHSGYIGNGFVDGYWNTGANTTFTVNAPAAGLYPVLLRYANGSGSEKSLTVEVNGQFAARTMLAGTKDWQTWGDRAERLYLNQGTNTITYRYSNTDSGNVNIDFLELDVSGATPATPSPSLVPTASPTVAPTAAPTGTPVASPTIAPTSIPTALPTLPPGTPAPELNRVKNGSFESGFDHWTEFKFDQITTYGVDQKDTFEGLHKLYFWHTAAYKQDAHQLVTNLPNGLYTFSAWIKLSAYLELPATARIELQGHDAAPVYIPLSNEKKWVYITRDVDVRTGKLDIGFYLDAKAYTSMQIDDVRLVRNTSAATPTPTTSPTSRPTATPGPTGTPAPTASAAPSPTPSPSAKPPVVNVLNGGFENGDQHWTSWQPAGQPKSYGIDSADVYQGSKKMFFWNTKDYEQSVSQKLTNLPNGDYVLSAWVKVTAYGQTPDIARMEAWDYGGSPLFRNFTVQKGYLNYQLNISVTSGTLDIRFYSKAKAFTSIQIDQVELIPMVKVESPK